MVLGTEATIGLSHTALQGNSGISKIKGYFLPEPCPQFQILNLDDLSYFSPRHV